MLEYGTLLIILVLSGLIFFKEKDQNEFQIPIKNIPGLTLLYRKKVWVHVCYAKHCLDNSQRMYMIENRNYFFDQKQVFLLNLIYKESLVKIIFFWIGLTVFEWLLWITNNKLKDFWFILVYCYLFYGMFIPLIGEIFYYRANKSKK